MTFEDALKALGACRRFGAKPGPACIGRLLELSGNPQKGMRFIHVAGTNGKGSTATAIACILTASGVRTGLFLSPHVSDFGERIQIDGAMIGHAAVAEGVRLLLPFLEAVRREGLEPTEFEVITALALRYYSEQGCGAAVLEVGLGGRFDATNIIDRPLVSVVTPISYDHTDILGDTLEKIAFEKCGIIKEGGQTVSAPQPKEAMAVVRRICGERRNELRMPEMAGARILREELGGTELEYKGERFFFPLAGRHQIVNSLTAFEAVLALRGQGFSISGDAVRRGMAAVRIPARLELLHDSPPVVLDGAHNPAGAAVLADAIRRYLPERPVLLMGMLADKDYKTAIGLLAPLSKAFVAVRVDSPRALAPRTAAETAARYCKNVSWCEEPAQAFRQALSLSAGAPVVICGSLYLAGTMRAVVRGCFGG